MQYVFAGSRGRLTLILCTLTVVSGSAFGKVSSLSANAQRWESIHGTWVFEKGQIRQTESAEGEVFLLKWKGRLPKEPFYLSFQMYNSGAKKFAAYVVIRSDPTGRTGDGFGVNNSASRTNIGQYRFRGAELRRTGIGFGMKARGGWNQFGLMVDGPCHELYYNSKAPLERSEVALIRGYRWANLEQDTLVLRAHGVPAAFRNITITPLNEVSPPRLFKIVAPENGKSVGQTRPTLKWAWVRAKVMGRVDLDYHISVTDESGRRIASGVTHQMHWRPEKSLSGGKYQWTITAEDFNGTIWGGTLSGTFTVPKDARKDFDALNVKGPAPRHFSQARPELTWIWNKNVKVDRVEIHSGGKLIESKPVSDNKLLWQPKNDLHDGLNRLELRFFARGDHVETVKTIAVRTRIPDTYSFRNDGVLLQNGQVFVPFASYRDPSESLTETTGLQQAGFTVTHDYHFEGSHAYRYKNKPEQLKEHFSVEFVDKSIEEAKQYLRTCDANGIKVFMSIRRVWVHYHKKELLQRYVGALMGEPGLLTWYLYDEPDWVGIPASRLRDVYETIKKVDPYHPVALCYKYDHQIPRHIRACDIMWPMRYGSYRNPEGLVNSPADHANALMDDLEGIRYARRQASGFKTRYGPAVPGAVWPTLWGGGKHFPTVAQNVAQVYASMIGRAPGIVYYWLPDTYKNGRHSEEWKAMVRGGKEVRKLMPLLLDPGKDLSVPSDANRIAARARLTGDGRLIVLLANLQGDEKGSAASWDWRLPKGGWSKGRILSGSGQWNVKADELTVTLSPLECLALEFRSAR